MIQAECLQRLNIVLFVLPHLAETKVFARHVMRVVLSKSRKLSHRLGTPGNSDGIRRDFVWVLLSEIKFVQSLED